MPNGEEPLPCPACEQKVIQNGGVAARVLDEVCGSIYHYLEEGGTFPNALKLVKMANGIEDKVFRFQREVLEQMGFEGPWPHSLTFADDEEL